MLSSIILRLSFAACIFAPSFISCDNETETVPKPERGPKPNNEIVIIDIKPEGGLPGDTILILLFNKSKVALQSVLIGESYCGIIQKTDSILKVKIPIISAGNYALSLSAADGQNITWDTAFTVLEPQVTGFGNTTFRVHPDGTIKDSLVILGENFPLNPDRYEIVRYEGTREDGFKVSQSNFSISDIRSDRITLKLHYDIYGLATASFYLIIHNGQNVSYTKLEGLKLIGYFAIDPTSYANVPEHEIMLREGNRSFSRIDASGFTSEVYLGGIKLSQIYHDPEPKQPDGFGSIKSFRVPPGLAPGEYELEVRQLDGVTPILPDSSNRITISPIKYCPEKNVFANGEDIRISLSPWFYVYRCYSCPETIMLRDEETQTEYPIMFKSKAFDSQEMPVIIFSAPAGELPLNHSYKILLKTKLGYECVVKEGCASDVITITE